MARPPGVELRERSGLLVAARVSALLTSFATVGALSGCQRNAALDEPGRQAVEALRESTRRTSHAYETVRSLTTTVGPRLAGSPGDREAVVWAEKAMRAAGLSNVHTEPVTVPRWERGQEHGALVAPLHRPLALTALGGSVGTGSSGIEAEVIEVRSFDAMTALTRAEVEGKILFVNVRMDRTRDGSGYGRAVPARGRGAIEGARRGAVATVIRSVGTDHDRLPHTGQLRYDDSVPKIPAAALSIPDADAVSRLLAAGQRVRLRLVLGAEMLPDTESANVVGEVPGRSRASEIVLLGGHLDAWDLGEGALDDGAGCAIVLEAGRQIAKAPRPPERTVRIVFFANEENGLAGGYAYAKAHAAELERHVVALEADAGDGAVFGVRYLGGDVGRPALRALAALTEPLGAAAEDVVAGGGADLIPLRAAGVPVVDVMQDETRYFDVHHTANDTFDKVRRVDLDQAAATVATLAYGLALTPVGFGRIPEDRRQR